MKKEDFTTDEIILTCITPYYNVLEYTKELAKALEPQLNNKVEWIIIDDGCNELELDNLKAKVIHLSNNSGGASTPRNVGIENAKGKYITFIDADDLVTDNYINKILDKCKEDFDYCLFSWQSFGIWDAEIVIKDNPPNWNCCVWNCIYKKNNIKNIKFNPKLCIGEDYEFNTKARYGKKSNIYDIIYMYRSGVKNGLTDKGMVNNDRYL